MYIIYSKLENREHKLYKAVSLSPAGTHFHANWVIKAFGHLSVHILPKFTSKVYIPDCMVPFMVKLLNDIKNMPALNDLCTYLSAQCMGGPSLGKQAILTKTAKIFHSTLSFGFSN